MKARLSLLLLCFSACAVFGAAPVVTPIQIADNIYNFDGPMANNVILTGDDGILLIDSAQTLEMTEALKASIATVSDKPIKYLVNTHKHFDHVIGNSVFSETGTTIIAHSSVRKGLLTEIPFFNNDKMLPASAAPTITFENEMTLFFDGEEIWLFHPQTRGAHTGGDIVVFFKHANVVHMGDLYCRGTYLFLDTQDGAWLPGVVASCREVLKHIDDKTVVIPGHGIVGTKQDLADYANALDDIATKIAAMMKQGKTLAEIQQAKPTAPYDATFSSFVIKGFGKGFEPDKFVEMVFNNFKSHGLE